MRRTLTTPLLALLCLMPAAASAQGHNSAGGFGGLSLNGFDTHAPSMGGTVTFSLTPGIEAVGEVGRVGNVLPTVADTVYSVSQSGIGVSAFYGEGGIRLTTPRGAVAPYAEATAGFARLSISDARLGTIGNAATSLALGLIGRTSPSASVGAGLLARSGPVVFDVGYRYKQLFANDVLEAVLGFGEPLHAHQVRAGIGIRF